jgi:serine/threonine-protein phosphatase 2B regulatory subunit
MGQAGSQVFDNLEKSSNCEYSFGGLLVRHLADTTRSVSAPELLRLKKRFMKLDRDGSGSIDKEEFLQIPQIANNPLAHRMIAIFDEEYVLNSKDAKMSGRLT